MVGADKRIKGSSRGTCAYLLNYMKHITKDYFYDKASRTLLKRNLDPKKHLLHNAGDVPAIDREVWDVGKKHIDLIDFRTTDNRRYRIDSPTFDQNKRLISYGSYGEQYLVSREHWKVTHETKQGQLFQPSDE